jgi:anti-sigma factor RsiW
VSACRSHAEQIGPYVLGALEPAEMEEMRAHLASCRRCAAEARALAGLPALLDQVHAEAEVAEPSPALEDAVLDRFVRDRAAAAPPRGRRRRQALLAAAGAAATIALALAVLWPGSDGRAYARAELRGHGAEAVASVAEVEAGTHVRVEAERLSRGTYELWCVREDGRWVNGGSFRSRKDGRAAAELTAAVRPGEYHLVVITRRSSGGERGAEVMRGELEY